MIDIRIDTDRIKSVMKANRWTARKIGFVIGVSDSSVAKWLAGESMPSAVSLKRLCDALDLSIEEIFVDDADERHAIAA